MNYLLGCGYCGKEVTELYLDVPLTGKRFCSIACHHEYNKRNTGFPETKYKCIACGSMRSGTRRDNSNKERVTMSKQPDSRPYFKVESYAWLMERRTVWRIVSIAGGDTIADNIPSADLAEAMRKGAEEARK